MIKFINALSIILAFLPGCSPVIAQQRTADKVDIKRLGPQIGERVPDFNLQDQTGTSRTLNSIMGSKGAMLVFYRSADW